MRAAPAGTEPPLARVLLWFCIGTVHWYQAGTVLIQLVASLTLALVSYWYCKGAALVLDWCCIGTALVPPWSALH